MSCDYIWKFTWTKFSYVIASVRPSGMKKLINTSVWKSPQKYISIDRSVSIVSLWRIWRQSLRKKSQMSLHNLIILWKKNRHSWRLKQNIFQTKEI